MDSNNGPIEGSVWIMANRITNHSLTVKIFLSALFTWTANHKVCTKIQAAYVTRPANIGHICTQNLALFLNFNLQYLLKYKIYDNEIIMPYSQINKKLMKVYRTKAQNKKSTIFWTYIICADMPNFRRLNHIILYCYVL